MEVHQVMPVSLLLSKQKLGDRVWFDTNEDGIQDAGEAGIADVVVRLLATDGTELLTTLTDANGLYHFTSKYGMMPDTDYIVAVDALQTPLIYRRFLTDKVCFVFFSHTHTIINVERT
jgi:hypothetical protein